MTSDLRRFVNPKFIRTVPLEPMEMLLRRHTAVEADFDLAVFREHPDVTRDALGAYFETQDRVAEGLIADLHRIAALGTRQGLRYLLEAARRRGVLLIDHEVHPERGEPKHLALIAFLDHQEVFDDASARLAFFSGPTLAEFIGAERGLPAVEDAASLEAFRREITELLKPELHGNESWVRPFHEDGEFGLMVEHGTPIVATVQVEEGERRPLCYRPLGSTFVAYCADEGRLKMRRVPKSLQIKAADAFATHILKRGGFFSGRQARDLYSLERIERGWPAFRFGHEYDPSIIGVRVIEACAESVSPDILGSSVPNGWSILAQDDNGCALEKLHLMCPDICFRTEAWRLAHVKALVEIRTGGRKSKVTVMIRPNHEATFRRELFEGTIMELLRHNGLCREQRSDRTAIAAE
jgi:hypothetical protein